MSIQIDLSSEISLNQQIDSIEPRFIVCFSDLSKLSETNITEATHLVRKTLKFYRAVLKLMKHCSTVEAYNFANVFLRDVGKEFSELRDAHVRSILIKELSIEINSIPEQSFWDSLTLLNQSEIDRCESIVRDHPNRFAALTASLQTSSDISHFFDQLDPDVNCMINGIKSSLDRSKRAFLIAKNSELYSDFHEWRKRLKDVQNQLKFLLGEEEPQEHELLSKTDSLCESLGRFNDFAMLIEWLEKKKLNGGHENLQDTFSDYLENRNDDLHEVLLTSGNDFYNNPELSVSHYLHSFLIE